MISDETLLLLNRATLASQTVRTAVHELNNVLQMISGYAELLQDAPDLPPSGTRRVEAILRQVSRGQAVLEAVRELTRSGGEGTGRADVGRAVERVLASRRYEHLRAGIAVTVDAGSAGWAAVPAAHLEQILLNLVLNAEEAVIGSTAPAIAVRAVATDADVTIAVEDSGGGVARGVEPFALFATGRPGAAAGLGLPASRLLAVRHGGEIEASAGASGWRVRLPAAGAS